MTLRVLYISQLAEPDQHDLSVYAGLSDGEEDCAWFESRLRELSITEAVSLTWVQVCLGDAIPDPDNFDAAIVGGSYHMISEDRPWHRRLFAWLALAREAKLPTLGICGGHQLMAAHFGAMVKGVPDDVWCDTQAVDWTESGKRHWLLEGMAASTPFHFANYEHVASVPDCAEVLATRGSSPAVALDFGDDWVSIQFHPEMTAATMARSWASLCPACAERYRESPAGPRLLLNFLLKAGLNKTNDIRPSGAS